MLPHPLNALGMLSVRLAKSVVLRVIVRFPSLNVRSTMIAPSGSVAPLIRSASSLDMCLAVRPRTALRMLYATPIFTSASPRRKLLVCRAEIAQPATHVSMVIAWFLARRRA